MITKVGICDFEAVYEIMKESFPLDEYRSYDGQKALFLRDDYAVFAERSKDGSGVKAFITLYLLEDIVFAEHFAVEKSERGKGLGADILSQLKEIYDKPICLEVELPENDIAKRRIAFYERNGFFLNRFPYFQPALSHDRSPVPLFIMTSGDYLSENEFLRIKKLIHSRVYGVNR